MKDVQERQRVRQEKKQRETLEKAVLIFENMNKAESWKLQSLSPLSPWQCSLHVSERQFMSKGSRDYQALEWTH